MCLQILVGVPVLVCLVFFALAGVGIAPLAVQVQAGQDSTPSLVVAGHAVGPSIAIPPNLIPSTVPAPLDNPILTSRAEHGSPLAGTVLGDAVAPEAEQQLFIAALEKAATQATDCSSGLYESTACAKFESAGCDGVLENINAEGSSSVDHPRVKAAEFAIDHLYAMADRDEQAGEYERADQWRSLARDLRREQSELIR